MLKILEFFRDHNRLLSSRNVDGILESEGDSYPCHSCIFWGLLSYLQSKNKLRLFCELVFKFNPKNAIAAISWRAKLEKNYAAFSFVTEIAAIRFFTT
jgi:hypothetical protein